MGFQSSIILIMLTFVILFSFLYASFLQNYATPHDSSTIPTEPRITQAQAIDIAEREYRRLVPEYQEAYLHFNYYNYSQELREDEEYQRYLRSMAPGWNLSGVKTHPDLLNLNLAFVHVNGTVYRVNATNQDYVKICDEPSAACTLGKRGGEAARDRLTYEVGAIVDDGGYDPDIHVIIDAETGKVVSSTPVIVQTPLLPRSVFENRLTIQELNKLIENPKDGVAIEIVQNASEVAQNSRGINKGYRPAQVFETLFNATWVVWYNYDSESHTITSDTGYVDFLGRKFDSGVIDPGESHDFVFIEPGNFPYHCEIHPWMRGELHIDEPFT